MHVLIQKSMKRTPLFIKKIGKNLWSTTNYLFWWIVRGDGNNHSGQNGAGKVVIKIRVSVSNGHMLHSRIGGTLMIFDFFEKHGAKYPPRRNSHSSIVRDVQPFSGEYSSPWQCHLAPIKSHPTSALCSNLTGAVCGLMQKQSWIFPCTQWLH